MCQFPPSRIVCLTEETVETLYLLDEQDLIVGVSGYAVRPPQVRREKPRVSAFTSADIPKILALEPDSRTLCLRDLYSCDGNLSGCWHRWASPHPLDTQRCSNVCIFQGGSNCRSGRNLRRQGTDKTIACTRGVHWLD